jgi:hypothetical protein
MMARDAMKLHNGDEVISKETGESISVLNVRYPMWHSKRDGTREQVVAIEGIGTVNGYGNWTHREIK